MFNRYYQEELAYLREMGREFSQAMPEAARFLGEAGTDPDVERVLEGVAFLTARIRQKLDDELPELTHAVMEMVAPHYLRPIPSMTIMRFEPIGGALREPHTVVRGSEIDSQPVDGTECRFRIAYDTPLAPLSVAGLEVHREAPRHLRLRFAPLPGVELGEFGLERLRLFLTGDAIAARSLYMCLNRYFESATLHTYETAEAVKQGPRPGESGQALPGVRCVPVGFDADEALLGYPSTSFVGFRLLQEYFAFPAKFMFTDIVGLDTAVFPERLAGFDLVLHLSRVPEDMPPVSASNIVLNCAPAINLFEHTATPIQLDHRQREYRLLPSGTRTDHYEIHSIDEVIGQSRSTGKQRNFQSLFQIALDDPRTGPFYLARRRLAMTTDGTAMTVAFIGAETRAAGETGTTTDVASGNGSSNGSRRAREADEVISFDLTCSNRLLPTRLSVGDINVKTDNSPSFARFQNITRPTAVIPPPLSGDDYWRLIAHLSLHHRSLLESDVLRGLLTLYNFPSRTDRQAERAHKLLLAGVERIEAQPATRLIDGSPVRGMEVQIWLNEENFGSEGELYLFGTILNQVLSQGVMLNGFQHLRIQGTKFGESHEWPAKIGTRCLI